jgi:hypothetical protein
MICITRKILLAIAFSNSAFVVSVLAVTATSVAAEPVAPCRIEVVDAENGWPVPLVELKTTHNVQFFTDNAGIIAFDLPELMGRETWFNVASDGYEVPADGFGFRGVRLTPQPGKTLTVKVNRTNIAKRLGRVTGAGLFGESQKLGDERDWQETGILGCDSVQNAVHRGRMFWAWGDTNLAHYPLGVFDMSSATTDLPPLATFEPPLRIKLDYFRDDKGRPRGVAKMPGEGPTWLSGYVSLPDKSGTERLVASYVKIKGFLTAYESGLCVWNDEEKKFERLRTLWTKSDDSPDQPPLPTGHPVIIAGDDGKKIVLFGDPLPKLRCEATFEAWQNPASWDLLTPLDSFKSAADRATVKPAAGSIAWNDFRKRWITVFHEGGGKPSNLGEVWYAEADAPTGPWGPATKIASHRNYTFYNVRLHPEFTPAGSPILLFEGTYTVLFANNPQPTPRYDYNQIMYRLDLDDPQLAPAQK